jgi:hypothetical protein
MKKLSILAIVAAMMTLATGKALAIVIFPAPTVTVSGVISYLATNSDNGTTSKGATKTVSFNNKSLMAMLTVSPAVQTTLSDLGLTTNIPAGSSLLYSINDRDLIITNKNGFEFSLDGYDPITSSDYDYGLLQIDQGVLFGSYSLNDTTGAGTEADQTSVYFSFNDGNGNKITAYGYGTLAWTYGTVTAGEQKAKVTVSFHPSGYSAEVSSNSTAISTTCTISGTGSGTIGSLGEPFYKWW